APARSDVFFKGVIAKGPQPLEERGPSRYRVVGARGVSIALGRGEGERVVVVDEEHLLVSAVVPLAGADENPVLPGLRFAPARFGGRVSLSMAAVPPSRAAVLEVLRRVSVDQRRGEHRVR